MTLPLPRMPRPRLREPVNLARQVQLLARHGPSVDPEPTDAELERARAQLGRALIEGTAPPVTRREAKALISLATGPLPEGGLEPLVDMVLATTGLGWRHLWQLWLHRGHQEVRLAPTLGRRLASRVRERGKFRRRLPAWLPDRPEAFEDALAAPSGWVLRDFVVHERPLWALWTEAQIQTSTARGALIAAEMARTGPDAWWSSMEPASLRAWAETQQPAILTRVASRMLESFGAGAQLPADLPKTPDRRALKSWVLDRIGDPGRPGGLWASMSERAREVCEMLLIGDELEKIFLEFQRHAEKDRAEYWARFLPYMRDALYVESVQTAVCLLVVDGVLVVEFGNTGNACYFYDAPTVPLRTLPRPPRRRPQAADFKVRRHVHPGTRGNGAWGLTFLGRQLHKRHEWHREFDLFLSRLGVRVPYRGRPG